MVRWKIREAAWTDVCLWEREREEREREIEKDRERMLYIDKKCVI